MSQTRRRQRNTQKNCTARLQLHVGPEQKRGKERWGRVPVSDLLAATGDPASEQYAFSRHFHLALDLQGVQAASVISPSEQWLMWSVSQGPGPPPCTQSRITVASKLISDRTRAGVGHFCDCAVCVWSALDRSYWTQCSRPAVERHWITSTYLHVKQECPHSTSPRQQVSILVRRHLFPFVVYDA